MREKIITISNNPIAIATSQRAIELCRKTDRTPQEEGQMQGLFAHPDNPIAAHLRSKEYLASQGLGEALTNKEAEELRIVRAENFRRNH